MYPPDQELSKYKQIFSMACIKISHPMHRIGLAPVTLKVVDISLLIKFWFTNICATPAPNEAKILRDPVICPSHFHA